MLDFLGNIKKKKMYSLFSTYFHVGSSLPHLDLDTMYILFQQKIFIIIKERMQIKI